jgi:RHS repeat-associated protein
MLATPASGNTVSYPLYEAHGNNVGLLGRNGSSFLVSNEKSYDAWGGLRTGTNANGKAAFCANLGHKQDDESGLVYMRARYYEPTSGRFVSEDSARQGNGWFSYCRNNPLNAVDMTGRSWTSPLTKMYSLFKRAMNLFQSASTNPQLTQKNIALIKEIIKDIKGVSRTAELLGQAEIAAGEMTIEDSEALGGFAALGVQLGDAEVALGSGTYSLNAVGAILAKQLETLIMFMGI